MLKVTIILITVIKNRNISDEKSYQNEQNKSNFNFNNNNEKPAEISIADRCFGLDK